MTHEAGKGSDRRPAEKPDSYSNGYDAIWGKKPKKEETPTKPQEKKND